MTAEKAPRKPPKRQWRDYKTPSGARPVRDFIEALSDDEAAAIVAAMTEVRTEGRSAARHLRDDVYEVRADARTRSFRILFAAEGRYSHVLLSLSAFEKRTQKTPDHEIELAETRLADWRKRGAILAKARASAARRER
jgi:phage-related protein